VRVRIWSEITAPEIVSSARMVMTVMVFIGLTSRPNVAENVKAWRIFGAKPRNNGDGPPDEKSNFTISRP